jgi:chemotaxis signal transduction protein
VLVIDGGRQPFGILADAARDFIDLAQTTVRPFGAEEASTRTLLRGITDDAVLVLDPDAVLAVGRAVAKPDDMGRGG